MENEEIFDFCTELAEIWRDCCPKWSFGEFMYVVFNEIPNAYSSPNKMLIRKIRMHFNQTPNQIYKRKKRLLKRKVTI